MTHMTESEIKNLLADYAAPTADDGFTDGMMARLRAEERLADLQAVDLNDYKQRPTPFWRSWLISAIIGLLFGLLWTRFGVALPDLSLEGGTFGLLTESWAIYGICGLGIGACLMLVDTEFV